MKNVCNEVKSNSLQTILHKIGNTLFNDFDALSRLT